MNFGRAIVLSVAAVGCSLVAVAVPPGVSPGPGIRYATDAYPGFDSEDELLKPSRKEPGWFGWISGPKKDTAAEQLAYAASLEAEESWKDAKKAYDALVREWPTSPEAPKAQKAIADICLGKLLDSEAAFAEYRYLLDFYSAQCNYDEIVELMYKTAENLRSMYPDSPEAATALYREAKARMVVLRRCEYNRERVRDTIGFLSFAIETGRLEPGQLEEVSGFRAEARALLEEEAYNAAKFYDSRTRTKRSAVSAYQRFLDEYPTSDRAPEVRRRLFELQEEGK